MFHKLLVKPVESQSMKRSWRSWITQLRRQGIGSGLSKD
jgi:hypothetical protein